MGRYIQKISLFPFSAQELWVGWELEGVDGEVPGLIRVADLTATELAEKGITEFQRIPFEYLGDLEVRPVIPQQRRDAV